MVDPVTLSAVSAVTLTEGIKFLFSQAGDVIRRWREDRASQSDDQVSRDKHVTITLPSVFGRQSLDVRIDHPTLDRVVDELLRAQSALASYHDGLRRIDPADSAVCEAADHVRTLLEHVLGQRLTLHGEARPPTGSPVVRGHVGVGDLRDRAAAAGVLADSVEGPATVEGSAIANVVDGDAQLHGTRIGRIGGSADPG